MNSPRIIPSCSDSFDSSAASGLEKVSGDFQVLLLEKKVVSPWLGGGLGLTCLGGVIWCLYQGDISPHLRWALGDEVQELAAGHRIFIRGHPAG